MTEVLLLPSFFKSVLAFNDVVFGFLVYYVKHIQLQSFVVVVFFLTTAKITANTILMACLGTKCVLSHNRKLILLPVFIDSVSPICQ